MSAGGDKEERPVSTDVNQPSGAERRLAMVNNRIDSRDLFIGTREVAIIHGADTYHLRLTALNKLILTK